MRNNSAKDFARHTCLAHYLVFCIAGFLIVLILIAIQVYLVDMT
jgi:hypothetical protein